MDQNDETQKIIVEQMRILPADVKQAILSVDYKTKLQEITRRQKLLIDEAGKFEMETTLVMIGLETLADYMGNLQRELKVSPIRAKEIAIDASENIFKPIRESLRAMNEQMQKAEEAQANPPAMTTQNQPPVNPEEANLNRNQILDEIENPIPNHTPSTATTTGTKIEIRPKQELETLPREIVKDITPDIVTAKMTDTTVVNQQVIEAKPTVKLPDVPKRIGKIDPYREPIN